MKNTKTAKIVSLIVILAALITCMVVMNVSAETADPQLESINLIYGDQIQIMVGTNVPTTEALGDLKVAYYKENPAENSNAEVFYATALPADSKYNYAVDGVKCWTFVTDGIPASAVSAERFVTIFNGDTVPADATYKTYSVMEYLFERLYRMDYISKEDGTIDGNKKNLYLKMIDYTAFAQQVLVNDNANIAEDIRLITEYNYVYAKGCKINGGGSSLILAEDGEVTLTLNDGTDSTDLTGWIVYTYDAAGNFLKSEPAIANTISVTSHTVIIPPAVDEDPTYIEFDDWATGPVTAHSSNRIMSFTEGKDAAVSNFQIVNNNGNAMLYYSNNNNYTPDTFHISAHNSSANSNVSVFETDVEWYKCNNISRSDMFVLKLYSGEDVVYTIKIGTELSSGSYRLRITGYSSNGGKLGDDTDAYKNAIGAKYNYIYLAPQDQNKSNMEYKFTMKTEYYHSVEKEDGTSTGVVKMWLDGANWGDLEVPELETPVTSVEFLCCYNDKCYVEYAFDNVRVENTEKVYVPYAPKQ